MNNSFSIKKVGVEQILPLRRTILRPGYTLNESRFEGDLDQTTFHLALIKNQEVLAIATFMKMNSNNFMTNYQYQLRGMAVAKKQQGKGLGKAIFLKGEEILKKKSINILWFNARTSAVNFYKKLGGKISGEEFHIPTVGPHYLMYKEL